MWVTSNKGCTRGRACECPVGQALAGEWQPVRSEGSHLAGDRYVTASDGCVSGKGVSGRVAGG